MARHADGCAQIGSVVGTIVLTEPLQGAQSPAVPLTTAQPSSHSSRWRRLPLADMAPYAVAVVSTLAFFRSTFLAGWLPGDIGDARWTVAIHEHWFRVWQGDDAIRDIPFFFPSSNTLGMSDAYFVQGHLHALARAFGLDVISSWTVATIGLFLVGALGVAALAASNLRSVGFRCAFVVLACLTYPMIVMVGHPQIVGFVSVSWLFWGADQLFRGDQGRRGVYVLMLAHAALGAVVLVRRHPGRLRPRHGSRRSSRC